MEIQGKPQRVVVRGHTISQESGKFGKDPMELHAWLVRRDGQVPWGDIDLRCRREQGRDDRKDVQIVVEFTGREYVPVLTANELEQVLADEPKPQPKIAAPELPRFVEQYTATIRDRVYGPFDTYGEASDFAHKRLGPKESWSSGSISVPGK